MKVKDKIKKNVNGKNTTWSWKNTRPDYLLVSNPGNKSFCKAGRQIITFSCFIIFILAVFQSATPGMAATVIINDGQNISFVYVSDDNGLNATVNATSLLGMNISLQDSQWGMYVESINDLGPAVDWSSSWLLYYWNGTEWKDSEVGASDMELEYNSTVMWYYGAWGEVPDTPLFSSMFYIVYENQTHLYASIFDFLYPVNSSFTDVMNSSFSYSNVNYTLHENGSIMIYSCGSNERLMEYGFWNFSAELNGTEVSIGNITEFIISQDGYVFRWNYEYFINSISDNDIDDNGGDNGGISDDLDDSGNDSSGDKSIPFYKGALLSCVSMLLILPRRLRKMNF